MWGCGEAVNCERCVCVCVGQVSQGRAARAENGERCGNKGWAQGWQADRRAERPGGKTERSAEEVQRGVAWLGCGV